VRFLHQSYEAEQKWWRTPFIKAKMIVMVVAAFGPSLHCKQPMGQRGCERELLRPRGAGVQLLIGYCGQVTLGHAAFVAVGGYCSTLLVLHFPWPKVLVDWGLAYPISMITAGVVAGLWSVLFGLPSARVKGFTSS